MRLGRATVLPLFARALFAGTLSAGLLMSAPVRAQEGTDDARAHYERGVALFDEARFDAALAEFEAAYALSGRASLLFNIGQIHGRLGHAVESADALSRYLAEAREIGDERRAQVEAEIATQRARIGTVRVEVRSRGAPLAGAVISLDDVERGAHPLAEPLQASAGEHVLTVVADGHAPGRQRFRLAGLETRVIEVDLVPTAGPETAGAVAAPPHEDTFPVLTVTGGVIAGAGLVTWAVAGTVTLLEAQGLTSGPDACSPSCPDDRLGTLDVTRVVADVGLGVLGVGAVLLVVGAVLELGGEEASDRARLGRGGVEVTF